MARGIFCCGACAQELQRLSLGASRHVGSSFPDQGWNLCPVHGKADS